MGGLAALLRFDRAPVDPALVERLAGALGGAPATNLADPARRHAVALALVPRGWARESLGRAATVRGTATLELAFDGRLDDRAALATAFAPPGGAPASDAELVLAGYVAWGDALFDRLVGPYALVLADAEAGWLRLARDPLGGRPLFYRRAGALVAVATRAAALLDLEPAVRALDEESIARYLAIEGPRPGSTFFEGVRAVEPGELVVLTAGGTESRLGAQLAPVDFGSRPAESELARLFRDELDRAVACRLPRDLPSAVLMSGGLDSTAIAASSAALAAAGHTARPPITVSWLFDELTACDERRWIDAASRATGLSSLRFAADELWPLADEPAWPRSAEGPFLDLYWRLLDRALRLTSEAGCAVLLTGHTADDLWGGGEAWLASLVAERRYGAGVASLGRAIALRARGYRLRHGPRSSLGRLVRRPRPSGRERPWLTPSTAERLRHGEPAPPTSPMLLPHHLAMLDATDLAAEPSRVEIRRPFRDRRLVELLLAVPPHQLYRPGESKRLLRRASLDRLPRALLSRRALTSLVPLARRGLAEREWTAVSNSLRAPDAVWPRYVDADWLWSRALPALSDRAGGVAGLVLWHCYSFERWRRTLAMRGDFRIDCERRADRIHG